MSDQEGDTKGLMQFLRQEWDLAPRALIASIPIIGHSISVVIEDQIAKRNQNKILVFAKELENRLKDNQAALDRVSHELVDFALAKLVPQPERWKPRAIANILALHKGDNDLLFKQLLIDHTSQLTDFDLAIFWDLSDANPDIFPAETRYAMMQLQALHPEVGMLRTISEQKLVRLGFLRMHNEDASETFAITDIGLALVEAIK